MGRIARWLMDQLIGERVRGQEAVPLELGKTETPKCRTAAFDLAAIAGLWIVTLVRLLQNADVEWAGSMFSGIKNLVGTIDSQLP